MEYRNQIPELGTTISGFANSLKKKKKLMPTDQYSWNIVESGVKHHNPNPLPSMLVNRKLLIKFSEIY
jgi:hypothetical protein